MTTVSICAGLLLAILGFVAGWVLNQRRAMLEKLRWHYAICAAFIGLRKCLDEKREDMRDYLTAEAQIQYRLSRHWARTNAGHFPSSTDELFAVADHEFAAGN
jgi:hypothetical protein